MPVRCRHYRVEYHRVVYHWYTITDYSHLMVLYDTNQDGFHSGILGGRSSRSPDGDQTVAFITTARISVFARRTVEEMLSNRVLT